MRHVLSNPLGSSSAANPYLNQFQTLTTQVLQQVLNPAAVADNTNSTFFYDASTNEFVVQGFFIDAMLGDANTNNNNNNTNGH
jgi:hypothetical protein